MHLPPLILDLAVILSVAALVTFVFRRIKQPVVLGYIVAGVIVGPYTPAVFSVADTQSIQIWAELGVIFLMFSLGLEFSFRRLARVGMSAGVTALVQLVVMIVVGAATAKILGWSRMDAVFLGCMIAISSTTIIIKTLEELGLKTKRFAELVFGILIVEDLAAILMLVALTNIATTSQIGGIELLMAGAKLGIVVGVWFVVGIFLVPRFVWSVSRHGNDEMLTVVATGLCLALVALASTFNYSVALGAFIMGSILAESAESKRIERLVQPLKDIFGAVFFVSVGMLLDPRTLVDNLWAILLLAVVIIFGKIFSVTIGAFITGQSLRNSVQTGFSMAQIGEFSFIIASLGLAYKVISPKLYPVIVAASLVTTFTTPYLVRASRGFADKLAAWLPQNVQARLDSYGGWVQRRTLSSDSRRDLFRSFIKWTINAVVVITLFTVSADQLVPFLERYFEHNYLASGLGWIAAFLLSAPSIWAMLTTFKQLQLLSKLVTVGLVGLLSIEFFPALLTLVATVGICVVVFLFFRRQVESYYRWLEDQFRSGFQADLAGPHSDVSAPLMERLAPWDAHLVEIKVPVRSFLVGKSLIALRLRETYGLSVVVILRDGDSIVAPPPQEVLYPGDRLLCFATDNEIERFRGDIEAQLQTQASPDGMAAYDMRRMRLPPRSPFIGRSIKASQIREAFACIAVGLERGSQQIHSPGSELVLAAGDVLWVVGDRVQLQKLEAALAG